MELIYCSRSRRSWWESLITRLCRRLVSWVCSARWHLMSCLYFSSGKWTSRTAAMDGHPRAEYATRPRLFTQTDAQELSRRGGIRTFRVVDLFRVYLVGHRGGLGYAPH